MHMDPATLRVRSSFFIHSLLFVNSTTLLASVRKDEGRSDLLGGGSAGLWEVLPGEEDLRDESQTQGHNSAPSGGVKGSFESKKSSKRSTKAHRKPARANLRWPTTVRDIWKDGSGPYRSDEDSKRPSGHGNCILREEERRELNSTELSSSAEIVTHHQEAMLDRFQSS